MKSYQGEQAVTYGKYLTAQAEIKRDFLLAPVLATKPRKPKWTQPGSSGRPGVTTELMIPLAGPFRCWSSLLSACTLWYGVFQHQRVVGKLKK